MQLRLTETTLQVKFAETPVKQAAEAATKEQSGEQTQRLTEVLMKGIRQDQIHRLAEELPGITRL